MKPISSNPSNKSKSQNSQNISVHNHKKSKYNTRSNPRSSFLNRSLSSIPKPNTSGAPINAITTNSQSVPSLSSSKSKPNILSKQNNSGISHCSTSSSVARKSVGSKSIGTPVTRNGSAASPKLPVSKFHRRSSNLSSTSNSGNPSTSVSSVLSVTKPNCDLVIAASTLTPTDTQSSSTPQDVPTTHSVDHLLRQRDALIDKVMELTTRLEHQNTLQAAALPTTNISPSTDAAPDFMKLTSKIAIFSDSMCRGVSEILRTQLPNTHVTSDVKPGAHFSQVVASIPSQCKDFGPSDYVFIHAGTNDMDSLQPNSAKRLQLPSSLVNLSCKTNVVLCSIPYRYDKKAYLSTNIYETNNFFKFVCAKSDFHYLDTNCFMFRPLFTKEGLHFNRRGKMVLASKLGQYIHTCLSDSSSFVYLTNDNTKFVSPSTHHSFPRNRTCTQVCDVGTQTTPLHAYDVDTDSTFGSLFHNTVNDIINLSDVNDDLLCNPSDSLQTPVIPTHVSHHQRSNFPTGVRTLVT